MVNLSVTGERRRKLALNQALFGEVNDRIHELAGAMRGWHTTLEIICECSDETCTEFISLAIGDYQPVREYASRFLIRPGHEIPEIERVVFTSDEYAIVEKVETREATKHDP